MSQQLFWDGLHFNAKGQEAMYEVVAKALEAEGKGASSLAMHRPGIMHKMYPKLFDEEERRWGKK